MFAWSYVAVGVVSVILAGLSLINRKSCSGAGCEFFYWSALVPLIFAGLMLFFWSVYGSDNNALLCLLLGMLVDVCTWSFLYNSTVPLQAAGWDYHLRNPVLHVCH